MIVKKVSRRGDEGRTVIQFNLFGLMLFSMGLLLVAGLMAYGVSASRALKDRPMMAVPANENRVATTDDSLPPKEIPAWGELISRDICLERPDEYSGLANLHGQPSRWVFEGRNPEEVRALMLGCGAGSAEVSRALNSANLSVTPTGTVLQPEAEFVLGLGREVRAKLYEELGRSPANHYMQFPAQFPARFVSQWLDDGRLDKPTASLIRQLLYPRGNAVCFSDLELVDSRLTTDEQRRDFSRFISRQPAVLAHLLIRPDTDVDKLVGYWGHGAQAKDIRPLVESLKNLGTNGGINLRYLLPAFARERLYIFPLQPRPGDPVMDCHWSTMNFFREVPDNRFSDLAYVRQYLAENYYPIAEATHYGDVIFLVDHTGSILHSVVYLGGDIVFTKNGASITQPWSLMHFKDLLAIYTSGEPPRVAVYRSKEG